MKTGIILPAVSNKATWREIIEVTDGETGEAIDIENDVDVMTVKIRDPDTNTELLTASLADGTITVIDDGVAEFLFTADQMSGLTQKTYEIGSLVEIDGDTEQQFLGFVPVLKGL